MTDRVEAFRALHTPGEPLLLANGWDYASFRAFFAAGFEAVGTTSLGVAAASGRPDGVGATRAETLSLIETVAGLGLVTADIEGGFSRDADEVAGYVEKVARAGAVGVNLEDGRSDGTLAPLGEQCRLIEAIKSHVPALFLNARTDTFWLQGGGASVEATAQRLTAYLAAGADGVFVPGLQDQALISQLVGLGAPLNILFSLEGRSLDELAALGVARISLGSLPFRVALGAALAAVEDIAARRPLSVGVPFYDEVQAMLDDGA